MEDVKTLKPPQPKRKIKNQAEWKREKRKRSIIAGESHYSVKGEFVSRKEIGSDCKCKLKCYEKVDCRLRQMLFEGFYSLKSYDEQNAYLFGLIRKHDVKRKKNINSDRRTCTYKYYVRNQGKEIQVCKMAFAHIHAISFRKIRTLSEKLDQNILYPRDGRGKHDNRPTRTSPKALEIIRKHILYIFKSGDFKKFIKEDKTHILATEVNVAKLYLHFLQMYEQGAVDNLTGQLNPGYTPKVKSWLYRKVFHEEVKNNSLFLKGRAISSIEMEIRGKKLAYTKSNCLKNQPQKGRKFCRKVTIPEVTYSSTCQSNPASNVSTDRIDSIKINSAELSNMHFTTLKSSSDMFCNDTVKTSLRISPSVNNPLVYDKLEDSLKQKCNKICRICSVKHIEECNNCPSKISTVYNVSSASVISSSGCMTTISNFHERFTEPLETSVNLFNSSNEKLQTEIISDDLHTFCS
ncbi:hypothetical protein R5R35_001547 [Gryllus longicercus]|uniref:Uncharacterized protein n=1 Tax=Gryllus longicercus TaxID=2509291 RepID=A0AAN9WG09_9ORTH